jgi:uncharacterized protein YjbI with pentapeptide repeats
VSESREQPSLHADCAHCFALCCVAPAFAASADFAFTKPAGQPCPHLQADCRCGIHPHLRQLGFRGCAVYDCFGAGQKVSQVTFAGQDWRQSPQIAQQMFDVFTVMRQLHELLWYLAQALTLQRPGPLHDALSQAQQTTRRLSDGPPDVLLVLDVGAHRNEVNALLLQTSEAARADLPHRKDYRGANLIGARLKGADLRGASLRGALLIGVDLRSANLRLADLTGADCRDADLRGANLRDALFVTQSQLDAARGDAATTLPTALSRPAHWQPAHAASEVAGNHP